MALQSVTTKAVKPTEERNRTHDIWIGGRYVLTVSIDVDRDGFPAQAEQATVLNDMIQDLARAQKSVVFHAQDLNTDTAFAMAPIEAIADTIILLAQLSRAVHEELDGNDAAKEHGHGE